MPVGRWLDKPVVTIPTLNRGSPFSTEPPVIVIHYTGGRSAANTIARFRDPASRVSAHFVIAESGDITQMVDCQKKAWHAGESQIVLPSGEHLRKLNDHSIGIELDHDGWLNTLRGGRRLRTLDQVVQRGSKFWPLYPQEQIDALVDVINGLRLRDWVASPAYLAGHEDIAPGRKPDPGPAFPWDEVCERVQLTRLLPAE